MAPRGTLRLGFSGSLTNTFSHSWHERAIKREFQTAGQPFTFREAETLHERHGGDHIFFVDGDVLRVALSAELRLSRDVSLSAEVPWISFGAASLDAFIATFHTSFSFSHVDRDTIPRGGFQVVLQRPGGVLEFHDETPASGLGDVVLSGRFRRALSSVVSLAADLAVKLPTGSAQEFRGSGSADVGLLTGLSADLDRQSWFLELGYTQPGRWRGPLDYEVTGFGRVLVGATRALGKTRRTRVGLSITLEESPWKHADLLDVSQAAAELALGVSRVLPRFGRASLTLVEHLNGAGDGSDFGLRLALIVDP